VLGQRVCDALLDRFVLRPQRHFIVFGVLFHFCTAGRSRLLHGRFVGVLLRIGECRTQKKSARMTVASVLDIVIALKLQSEAMQRN
jgi:hypothetical protein